MQWLWVGMRWIPWTTCLYLDRYRTTSEGCRLWADFWYADYTYDDNSYYDTNTGYNYYDDYYA